MDPAGAARTARASQGIDGWFSPNAARLFALLDEAQRDMGVTGHLFEIGVHHGKSAVVLVALAAAGERVGACDLFGAQAENVSDSGAGDRSVFEANIARLAPGFDRLDVFEMPSRALDSDELARPVRFFHVDGGHLMEEALGDIRLAASVLHPAGVIVVDDPWRSEWPGVTEAALAFLAADTSFRPLLMGFNKLVLCRADCHAAYDRFIERRAWDYLPSSAFRAKRLPVAGSETVVFYIPSYLQVRELDVKIATARHVARQLSGARGVAHLVHSGARRLGAAARARRSARSA